MNDEIKNRLMKYLDSLESTTQEVVDFGSKEIPLYIQELLNWMYWESFMGLTIFLALILMVVYFGNIIAKFCQKRWDDGSRDCAPPAIIYGFVILVSLILSSGVFSNLSQIIKITVAPRVVLMEHLMRMR